MFCPQCGSQMTDDSIFCPACGKQVVHGNTTVKVQENPTSPKGGLGKIIFIAVVIIAVILLAVLIIIKLTKDSVSKPIKETIEGVEEEPESKKPAASQEEEGGFDSYEEVIDALFTAAYNKDEVAVVGCYPKEMESYAIQFYNEYRSKEYDLSNEALMFCFLELNLDNEYWYEIIEATEFTQSEIDELQSKHGLVIDEGYTVEVKSMGKYYQVVPDLGMEGYATDGRRGYLKVAKIGNAWYLVKGDALWNSDWYE